MAQSSYGYSIALILSCSILFMMATPGLAIVPNGKSFLPPLFRNDPAAEQCLSSLLRVDGCVHEIITSFFSLRIQFLGNACCKAFTEIDDKCWPKVFPLNPFFPPLVKLYCERMVSNAPPSPPKTVQQHAPVPLPNIVQNASPPPTTFVLNESQSLPSTDDNTGKDESQPATSEEHDN